MRLNMVHPPTTGKISKKSGNINMKTSKKKEKLSFIYKNYWWEKETNCFVDHQLV